MKRLLLVGVVLGFALASPAQAEGLVWTPLGGGVRPLAAATWGSRGSREGHPEVLPMAP